MACLAANDGCTARCRDAFVYDPELTDEQIVGMLKADYTIGQGRFELGVKIPERIQALL